MGRSDGNVNIDTGAVTSRLLALTDPSDRRILVVDDDDLELSLICDRLRARDFQVSQAVNGQEALDILEREWFPVVVTDWQMPVVDGLEFTQQLRKRGVTDTFVIMLTVLNSSFDYERAYESGVDDYLSKKQPDVELHARIHAAFTTLKLRRELQAARAALAAVSKAP
jgi:two-component system, cell cycle response regulator